MHLLPLSLAHRQQWVRGLQWCRLSRQHQSLQQPKYSIFSNFINFEYVHLALDPGHPEVRKGWDDITKWRKPSNFETVKPNTSNSFEQSIWSYRHFWALEFVSTKDTKKTSILHQKDKISSHLSVLLKATPLSPSSILYAVFTTYNTLSWHPIFPRIHAEEMSSNIK